MLLLCLPYFFACVDMLRLLLWIEIKFAAKNTHTHRKYFAGFDNEEEDKEFVVFVSHSAVLPLPSKTIYSDLKIISVSFFQIFWLYLLSWYLEHPRERVHITMPQIIVLCQPFYSMCSRCKSNMIENIILKWKGLFYSFLNRNLLSNRLRYKHNKSKHICAGDHLRGRE
jgi:hypothetical protein